MPLCLPHQVIDAFNQSVDDENPLFHVLEYRENDHSCAEENSRAVVKQYLSLCTHQDRGCA